MAPLPMAMDMAPGSGGGAPTARRQLDDCGTCANCRLKKKFGGPGQGKSGRRCVMRPTEKAKSAAIEAAAIEAAAFEAAAIANE
eukprot:5829771-Prymnesium_polylepis.1